MALEAMTEPGATALPQTSASAAGPTVQGYRAEVRASPLTLGATTEVELRLFDPQGKALGETDFRIAHERRIHLLIIDEGLTDYHHEHPTPKDDGKVLAFKLTPRKPGPYRVFVDVLPEATRRHLYLMTDLPGARPGESIAQRDVVTKTNVDGYEFELKLATSPAQGQTLNGELLVRDSEGKTVKNLEPVMGAYAHLVGFFEDRVTVEHIHPMGAEPTRPTDRGEGALRFRVTPTKPGLMRLFAQVKIDGRERFAPFTLSIAAK